MVVCQPVVPFHHRANLVLPECCARRAHELAQCPHYSVWSCAVSEYADGACRGVRSCGAGSMLRIDSFRTVDEANDDTDSCITLLDPFWLHGKEDSRLETYCRPSWHPSSLLHVSKLRWSPVIVSRAGRRTVPLSKLEGPTCWLRLMGTGISSVDLSPNKDNVLC